jgi:hypothetical protein
MKRFFSGLLALVLLILLATPAQAASGPEVLTIYVDLAMPGGKALVGAFVVQRQISGPQGSWSFNGMLDGRHLTANGTANERWDAKGLGTIELTAISAPGVTLTNIPVRSVTISTGNGGLITLVGVPFAVSGPINPPGAGDATLMVTNAGQGARVIRSLPNTAGTPAITVELIVMVLGVLGAALLIAGLHWLLTEPRLSRSSRQPALLRRTVVARRPGR